MNDLYCQLWDIKHNLHKIHALLEQSGEKFENDHIAIRTYNDERVNIAVLEKPFVKAGYVAKGEYFSNQKIVR
jgi:hypothetical protein